MALLGWVMMALAIWHFTIFLPDRFWAGIVGAFLGAIIGGVVIALLINLASTGSLAIPGRHATDIGVILYSVPGAILGIGLIYWLGVRGEHQHEHALA